MRGPRLAGKVAIVTGGGGGIGRATAERFAEEGARVVVADFNPEFGEAAAASARALAGNSGGDAAFVACDVTDEGSVRAAVAEAVSRFGRLDILHNNAGGSTPADGPVVDAPVEEFWRAIKLDLFGTFLVAKVALPHIIAAGGGSVINMASNLALMAIRGRSCYIAAKGGVASLTRSMALDYAPHSIRVNAIAPSATATERVLKLIEINEGLQKLRDQHLLGLVAPVQIADLAVYLASDESRTTTGQIIPVDSGVTIY